MSLSPEIMECGFKHSIPTASQHSVSRSLCYDILYSLHQLNLLCLNTFFWTVLTTQYHDYNNSFTFSANTTAYIIVYSFSAFQFNSPSSEILRWTKLDLNSLCPQNDRYHSNTNPPSSAATVHTVGFEPLSLRTERDLRPIPSSVLIFV